MPEIFSPKFSQCAKGATLWLDVEDELVEARDELIMGNIGEGVLALERARGTGAGKSATTPSKTPPLTAEDLQELNHLIDPIIEEASKLTGAQIIEGPVPPRLVIAMNEAIDKSRSFALGRFLSCMVGAAVVER